MLHVDNFNAIRPCLISDSTPRYLRTERDPAYDRLTDVWGIELKFLDELEAVEDAMEEKLGLIDPEVFRDMELLISIMIFLEDDFLNARGLEQV